MRPHDWQKEAEWGHSSTWRCSRCGIVAGSAGEPGVNKRRVEVTMADTSKPPGVSYYKEIRFHLADCDLAIVKDVMTR